MPQAVTLIQASRQKDIKKVGVGDTNRPACQLHLCSIRDSNPHGSLHQILSLARLPITPMLHHISLRKGTHYFPSVQHPASPLPRRQPCTPETYPPLAISNTQIKVKNTYSRRNPTEAPPKPHRILTQSSPSSLPRETRRFALPSPNPRRNRKRSRPPSMK